MSNFWHLDLFGWDLTLITFWAEPVKKHTVCILLWEKSNLMRLYHLLKTDFLGISEAWFGHWWDLFVFKRNCVKRRIASNNKMHLHLFLFEYWVWKCLFESEVGGIAAVHQSWQFPRNKFSLIRINPAPGAMCLPVSPAQLSLTF